jgi:NTP pyrophosphatase (non-canonical NTP hydrolase)
MDINKTAELHWEWIKKLGWNNKLVLEELALVASEVGEAINECRGSKPTDHFGEELADIILRVFGVAKHQGIDIDEEIRLKMIKNEKRGTRGRIK